MSGSPVRANAWQRQPPQSISRRSQLRHGSGIQSVPRNRLKALECSQIQASGRSVTLSNSRKSSDSAAWQGSTLPAGVMLRNWRPQPPMHDFGRRA